MAKTKTPFFGLEAHGSVGGSITAQSLPKETLIRTKPLPTYRYTLPQAYQRWLYEDYAYLWTQQTDAVKAQHRTAGHPYHLTAFQMWMKYNLTHLPDILGYWPLDSASGAIVPDRSRNALNGTIIGATPVTGLIAGAFYFDGLNDTINLGASDVLRPTTAFSLELFVYIQQLITHDFLFSNQLGAASGFSLYKRIGLTQVRSRMNGLAPVELSANNAITVGAWTHLVLTYDPATPARAIYSDGNLVNSDAPTGTIIKSTISTHIGSDGGVGNWLKGNIDQVIMYNRVLDITEIERHSLRRYSLQ